MSSVIEQSARERARELAARGAVDELTGMLCSQDWRERQEAAFALSQMGSVVVEPMIRVLGNRELSWEARGHAAWVLRHVGDPSARPALLEALADEDGHVRGYAAYALGRIGDRSCVSALIEAYHRDDQNYCHCRHWIVTALGEIGDPAAEEFLKTVAESDPDGGVRLSAQRALRAIEEA